MNKTRITIAIALAMLSIPAAQAQGYLGIGAGWANIAVDCGGLANCDKSSTGYKLYGGFRYASGWAFEGVYIDWGKATATMTDTVLVNGSPITVTGDGKLRATGFGIGGAYIMPFTSDWGGAFRLGVMRNKGKMTINGTGGGITVSDSASKNGTFAYFGLGVGYQMSPNLALTGDADFSRVKYGAEGEYQTDNVRLFSLGLRYSF